MKITRHRLYVNGEAAPYQPSPNVGGELRPSYLILHFTAGSSAGSSIDWLTRKAARASAHLVIGRDGTITQLVPFNRVAWHAGVSEWEGLQGMNQHAIGIELDNAGRLERKGRRWCAWFGTAYSDDEVMVAAHKHEQEPVGWHLYTPAQLEATLLVGQALVEKYGLKGVAGHDDIAPGRKSDPGPAFPMANIRSRLFGRADDTAPLHAATTHLNIRTGPGIDQPRLDLSPLQPDTELRIIDERGPWRLVTLVHPDAATGDIEGWVHGAYLRALDTTTT